MRQEYGIFRRINTGVPIFHNRHIHGLGAYGGMGYTSVMTDLDYIIIGGGAAGLMCAGQASKRGRRGIVIEHAAKVGQKIRISGGGRANFTNLHTTAADFLSDNPRFCISALKRYTQFDFIALVEKHDITYHQRDHGQLFCDGSAQQIIDMLLSEASGVPMHIATSVQQVSRSAERFHVQTDQGDFSAASLVIATGGPSIPKMGSSDFGCVLARQFGLKVIEPRPGLVPLTFDTATLARLQKLAGISLNATIRLGKVRFSEALLFTHRGLSGPVILQISSYWQPGQAVVIDLLPGTDIFQFLKDARTDQPKKDLRRVLAQCLPKRLAHAILDFLGCDGRLGEASDKSLRRVADHINAWSVTPNGSEGYRTAEVTVGGVDTRELSSKSMQANTVPGLYFIGETVDVTGHLGGFNFQWAWASGHACGLVV